MCQEGFAFNHDLEWALSQINLVHVSVLYFQTEALSLFTKLHHHFRPANALGIAREVFDVAGEHELAARHVTCEHERVKHGASRIKSSGVAGRP